MSLAAGVVSLANRSLGVHSSAAHKASKVLNLTWVGCLVNSAGIDAEESSRPALSMSSRRNCAPVHISQAPALGDVVLGEELVAVRKGRWSKWRPKLRS